MQIKIKNFRNIKATELDFTAAAAIFGNNAQGKSSVLYAVQYALYSRCAMTDGRGAGSERLIRDGAKDAEIEISLNDVVVHCTIKARGSNEWYCTTPDGEVMEEIRNRADLWKHWGLNLDRASIAGMPELYLDSKELGDVLAGYLAGTINVNNLLALCGPHQDWIKDYAAKKHVELADPTDLPRLGKLIEETRRDLNRDVKSTHAALEQLGPVETDRDTGELPTIESKIAGLNQRLAALNQELGRAQTARPNDAIDADLTTAQAALQAAQNRAETCRAEESEWQYKLDAAICESTLAQQNDATSKVEYSAVERRIQQAQKAIKAVQDRGDCCPTCGQSITAAVKETLLGPLTNELKDAEKALKAANKKCNTAMEAIKNANTFARDSREKHREAQLATQTAATDVRTVTAQIEALQREATITTRPVDTITADITTTSEKIKRGETLVAQLKNAKQIADHNAFLAHSAAELEHLNWGVEYFRDGAAIKELTGSRMHEFCDAVNAHTRPHGLVVTIEQDGKHVAVEINHRPAKALNTGARALAAYGLARAFAGGAPVLLDDINHLDAANRKALLLALRQAGSEVLVAGTWQQAKPLDAAAALQLAPLAVFWMEDGAATKLTTEPMKEVVNA